MDIARKWLVAAAVATLALVGVGCTAQGEITDEGIQGEVEPEEGDGGGEGGD